GPVPTSRILRGGLPIASLKISCHMRLSRGEYMTGLTFSSYAFALPSQCLVIRSFISGSRRTDGG
ncbi:hypothetical protein, partial [Methanothrix sp.]|uniref:hypothetical protein n=1 Tax=Methanothrix sp. TaxID=90426 RepID=UPI003C70F1B6